MSGTKALFVVIDGLLPVAARLLAQRLSALLGDFRAHGYKIIGITLNSTPCRDDLSDALDAVIEVDKEFAPAAWSLARRFRLDMRHSIFVSNNLNHESWARDAGVRRFETPSLLFGI